MGQVGRRALMRIGLTGGAGSGATQAARRLETRGAVVISGDKMGHVALSLPDVQNSLRRQFGAEIFTNQGEVDRPALGRIIFANEDAREILSHIVHPILLDLLTQEARQLELQRGIVVVDAALIYEWGVSGFFHRMIVVEAPLKLRLLRIMARDGLSEEQAQQRIAAQWPLEKKISRADFVIHNGGTLDELNRQVDQVWTAIENEAE